MWFSWDMPFGRDIEVPTGQASVRQPDALAPGATDEWLIFHDLRRDFHTISVWNVRSPTGAGADPAPFRSTSRGFVEGGSDGQA